MNATAYTIVKYIIYDILRGMCRCVYIYVCTI